MEEFELHDTPTEVGVAVAIITAVGDLPEHYIRSREMRFNRDSKRRIANRLAAGQKVTKADIEHAIMKNDASGTVMTKVVLEGGWREKRYNVALVVKVTEYNGNTPVSNTVRTIMGWVREDPHPTAGLPDDAVININTVVTRDIQGDGSIYGTVRNSAKLTGKASDEIITKDKKILIGDNIANQIQFQADYHQGNTSGGFTSTIISDSYNTDTKISGIVSDSSTILTEAINDSLFDTSEEPLGIDRRRPEVDEFVLLLNSHTTNHTGQQTGLKSFTWGAFKAAVGWSDYDRLEVFKDPAAPIFDPTHHHGSTESIEHDTRDTYINDIGFPLVHGVCSIIERYGLSLLNLTFTWMNGLDSVVYSSLVRPLDNSELQPVMVNAIELEAKSVFDRLTSIMGVDSLEIIFDGGFGKSSGIMLRVNSSPSTIPLVVSPAQTSLYNESIVESSDDRVTNATASAIAFIMDAHGKSTGGYQLNTPIQDPLIAVPHPVNPANTHQPIPDPRIQQSGSADWMDQGE